MKIADFDITKGVGDEPMGHVLRLHEKKKRKTPSYYVGSLDKSGINNLKFLYRGKQRVTISLSSYAFKSLL